MAQQINTPQTPDWKGIFLLIGQQRLLEAITLIRKTAVQFPVLPLEDVNRIEEDYRIMLHYAGMGFNDPERDNVYRLFIRRLYRAVANMRIIYRRQKGSIYELWMQKTTGRVFTHDSIRRELEDFVATKAMLSLESETTRKEKASELYQRHQDFMAGLFCKILVAAQWTETDGAFFTNLLLSPTIDSVDALLLVSAVTLANLQEFDCEKFCLLLNVYEGKQSSGLHGDDVGLSHLTAQVNPALQQRALVGWAFAVKLIPPLFTDIIHRVRQMCQNEHVARQLTDMQKQVIFCMDAEKDHDTIQRDIMPSLIRNSNLNITRDGMISEKEDDPMEDILDSDAADRRMEELEGTFQKMINMQKAGSDIYFGGFAQMKRTPFFHEVSNWFCPFYEEHPAIRQAVEKIGNTHFMDMVLGQTPLCDSDKYSLIQAFASVFDRLPANIREIIGSGAMGMEGLDSIAEMNGMEELKDMMGKEDRRSPSPDFVRRFYLQDLYRFYRLFYAKNQMQSPFATDSFLFIAHLPTEDIYSTSAPLQQNILAVYDILRKRSNTVAQRQLTQLLQHDDSVPALLIRGIHAYEQTKDFALTVRCMQRVLEKEPGHEKAQLYLARACFQTADYHTAEQYYRQLLESQPDKMSYQLNLCIAMANNKHYEEALPLLYKMNYEHPDDTNILRVLAWTLMGMHRIDQALEEYEKISALPDHTASDTLNHGYCLWIGGDVPRAVQCFRAFLQDSPYTTLYQEFQRDREMLADHQISTTDQALVIDLVML